MLDTRHIPNDEDYSDSKTLTEISALLNERYRAGFEKYGKHIDDAVPPTELTGETSFSEMALNELVDGITYAYKAKQEFESLKAQHEQLLTRHAQLNSLADDFTKLNEALVERVAELEEGLTELQAELDMARFEADQAKQEGDLSREQEAELVHENLRLTQEVEKLKSHLVKYRYAYNEASRKANMFKRQYEDEVARRHKVPAAVRGFFHA